MCHAKQVVAFVAVVYTPSMPPPPALSRPPRTQVPKHRVHFLCLFRSGQAAFEGESLENLLAAVGNGEVIGVTCSPISAQSRRIEKISPNATSTP